MAQVVRRLDALDWSQPWDEWVGGYGAGYSDASLRRVPRVVGDVLLKPAAWRRGWMAGVAAAQGLEKPRVRVAAGRGV